ncbi:MAG TPA: phosphoribosyltransferase family protein [Deltaproteobacteria bacterium]|jgi:predicted phosphoribosyltransferase|nr:phosphoribosyltransferase family protein [Deltaproteobacteria bacterium]HOD72343.1 phosphoribosyltransferase family protein [Deltaproteobacteria bacterium]HQM21721.1 phosphoribosyltransferase family protein [Deltaproteobacteria bacterium]
MGNLKIISHSEEPFMNREEAGRLLADELREYEDRNPVVLGIPRGGVIVAGEIARILHAELDVVLSRKLGAPGNPELAIGAISEDGTLFLDEDLRRRLSPHNEFAIYVEDEREKQYTMIAESLGRFRSVRPKVPLKGRTVIITDDGIATGSTMQASIWTVRREVPEKIIAAVPVGSIEALERTSLEADETVVLKAPPIFYAVGQFYEYFTQTGDEEVIAALRESADKTHRP